jgi:hypothetical protein
MRISIQACIERAGEQPSNRPNPSTVAVINEMNASHPVNVRANKGGSR